MEYEVTSRFRLYRNYKPIPIPIPTHLIVTIQKFFRGFRVRKTLKNILLIRQQVNEIGHNFKHKTNFILKENPKLNESLMSLLLQLDSISCVDVGLRNIRKSVIDEIVKLQKYMDECSDDTWQSVGDRWKVNEDEWLVVGSNEGVVDDKKKLIGLMLKLVKMTNEQMGFIFSLTDRVQVLEIAMKDRAVVSGVEGSVNKVTSNGKPISEYDSLMNRVEALEKKFNKKKKKNNNNSG